MVTIQILSNTRAKVLDLPPRQVKFFDLALSYRVEGAQFSPAVRRGLWDGKRHLFYVETCTFPKGLLHRVEALLKEASLEYRIEDLRKKVLPPPDVKRLKPDMLNGIVMEGQYSYQLDAARAALTNGGGILWLATNAGKTEIACAITKALH